LSFLLDTKYYETNEYEIHFNFINNIILEIAFNDLKFKEIRTEVYNLRPVHLQCLNNLGFVQQSMSKNIDNIETIFQSYKYSQYIVR
jgi:hypothetical protein